MRMIGHSQNSGPDSPGAPKPVKWLIMVIEVGLVILVAYQLAQLTFALLEDGTVQPAKSPPVALVGSIDADVSRLTSFDPFYRQVTSAEMPQQTEAVPESNLKIEVFGLRAGADGRGSAIVKMQGDDGQKLVQVGDQMSSGVTLVGVYADRLEVRRRGNREAIYLRPQAERNMRSAAPTRPGSVVSQRARQAARQTASQTMRGDRQVAPSRGGDNGTPSGPPAYSPGAARISSAIKGLALAPVRRNSRIVGFRIPDTVPPMVAGLGLEGGDILLKANGSSLASFERIEELGEELAGAARLELEIERRGQTIVKAIDLR